MKNIITLRSLRYTATQKHIDSLGTNEKFRDLARVGKLLNALTVAEREMPHLVATFVSERVPIKETILLTGGLLYDALQLAKELSDRYTLQLSVFQMHDFFNAYTDFETPEILIDMRFAGPFQLFCQKGRTRWMLDSLTGRKELIRKMELGEKGIPFAVATDPDEFRKKHKGEMELDRHGTLERLIDDAVDEFTYAAEEFIYITARQLGLEDAPDEPREALKLAA
ncbi:MAG: hypothetical protein WBO10_05925 [Pyrinomonadaceae bacterium]